MAGSASLPAPAPQLPPGLQRPGAPPPGRAEGGESAALREAAEQFEALFIESMLKAMRETVPEGGLLEGENEDVYRDMLDRELAKRMAERDGYGLAEALVRQLAHPERAADAAGSKAGSPGAKALAAYRAAAGRADGG